MLSLQKKVFIVTLHNHYKKVVLTVRLDLIQLVRRKKTVLNILEEQHTVKKESRCPKCLRDVSAEEMQGKKKR